jgi:hypothetical protein
VALGFERIRALLEKLANPQEELKTLQEIFRNRGRVVRLLMQKDANVLVLTRPKGDRAADPSWVSEEICPLDGGGNRATVRVDVHDASVAKMAGRAGAVLVTGSLQTAAGSCAPPARKSERSGGIRFMVHGMQAARRRTLRLAREVLPNSPASRWDAEWARQLCEATLARLNERHASLSAKERVVVDTSLEADWIGRMNAAARANDPAAFRAAVMGWERAALEAMERVRVKGGAA